jgi:hypothetical protein
MVLRCSGTEAINQAWMCPPHFPVTQFGARRLWDEVAAAYLTWLRSGTPGRERYGITVDAAGTQLWLDNRRTSSASRWRQDWVCSRHSFGSRAVFG